MKTINEIDHPLVWAAALKFGSSALKEPEVAVGKHALDRLMLTMIFPEGAMVERVAGSLGEGYEAGPMAKAITLSAALLFIEKSGIHGPSTFGLYKACILEANERKLKPEALMAPEAMRALINVQEAMPEESRPRKRTSAVCIGISDVVTRIERVSIKAYRGGSRKPVGA